MQGPEDGRSARKRKAIMEAATELFLCKGYPGTSMDEIAATAAVSKQTVYKQFADKETLFGAIIANASVKVGPFVEVVDALRDTENLDRDLAALARHYIATVIQPRGLQLRRLLIAEAGRFPEVAADYYERAPERTIAALAACFEHLAARGLLTLDDPLLAARHFAWLILAVPMDHAMFYARDDIRPLAELERLADEGARVFLAAYARR
ncbi:TetR/AcrR family transcriptional regulator [Streptomyces qinzhouensis]|uniref:TetR/AcrR family transcriptional regulator n=1 Tax=Streptomyces qinzhouensis TaxID=2599401 RepID=A0A5B8J9J9_9ACTN|nr:TetR/AcrR family transcriptional regulator [Streptomyces qinzhouensis]QDY77074.1 TetR/AcrR family transcriptional regulator [Streptomyces qinzhouensis]